MTAPPQRQPNFIQLHHSDPGAVNAELSRGLMQPQAQISPKYLYDALGSRLFAAITELPEYYPTRTEAAIFERCAAQMAGLIAPGSTLVDLGAGNCEKASRLFAQLRPARYVAVDISVDFLRDALQCLQRLFGELEMLGLGLDFSDALVLPAVVGTGPRLVFYPGSSIGNFAPDKALAFLRQMRLAAQGGALLIGVDLVKPVAVLEPAYDDPLGVTAAFNRNLLLHINRQLGSDFDIANWRHRAYFNTAESRIEMHLHATGDQRVSWPGGQRTFCSGQSVHTENSYKYTAPAFEALLAQAGFEQIVCWRDSQDWFAVFGAQAGAV